MFVWSVAQSCPILCHPKDCSMPGFPVLHYLPDFTQTQCPLSWWWHPTISSSVSRFSCLQSFPESGSCLMSQFISWDCQSIGASASESVRVFSREHNGHSRHLLPTAKEIIIHMDIQMPSLHWASLVAQLAKNLPAMQKTQVCPWVGKIPWRRKWLPTSVFLPGESRGQRSLEGGLQSMGSHTTVFQVEKKRMENRGLFALWGISGWWRAGALLLFAHPVWLPSGRGT